MIEGVGGGKDTVIARGDYTLGAGQEIEVLKLVSEGFFVAFGGTGNEFANTIIGNDHDNTLDGGKGNDTLTGGKGSDIYVVDSAGDKVTESGGPRHQRYRPSPSIASYTLGANLENLFLVSPGLNGTGNAANNLMEGNGQDNTLDGGGGNDDLAGSDGHDSLVGGAGNDSLDGGTGIDTMKGGAGNDTYDVQDIVDKVVEAAGGGIDLVRTTVDGLVLAANVENLTLQGAAVQRVRQYARPTTSPATASPTRSPATTATTRSTAAAAPTIWWAARATTPTSSTTWTTRSRKTSARARTRSSRAPTYVLAVGHEIEIVTLTGNGDFDADGNNFANTINGNSGRNSLDGEEGNDTLNGGDGNDTLDGGAGVDVMNGGKGDDTYSVDDAKDKVTEAAGQGIDTVFEQGGELYPRRQHRGAAAGYRRGSMPPATRLPTGWKATIVGNKLDGAGGDDDIEGHSGADTLIGGAGNDTLDGGSGDDTMTGGAGNDVYIVSSLADKITELAGGGIDLVRTEISGVTLAAKVENLELVSVGDISGTGNELSNYMKGSDGKNGLFGLDGNDTLDGGANGDVLSGGKGNDTYFIDNALDIVFEGVGAGQGYGAQLGHVQFQRQRRDRDPDPGLRVGHRLGRQQLHQHHHHGSEPERPPSTATTATTR